MIPVSDKVQPPPVSSDSRRGRRSRILIAGLGNLLLRDDGVGVHVVQALQRCALPGGVLAVEVGTAPLDSLHLLEWATEVHAIDAVEAGGPPGTLYRLGLAEAGADGRMSLHELGLRSVCHLLPPERRPRVTVWGVEPEIIDFGLDLSPAVQRSVPELVRMLRDRIGMDQPGAAESPCRGPAGRAALNNPTWSDIIF
jgi:hydrogenase maturation protease